MKIRPRRMGIGAGGKVWRHSVGREKGMMGWQATELVRDGFPDGGARLLVMLILSTYANFPSGNSIHPSVPTIARQTHLTPDYVRDVLKSLVKDGWLIVESRGTGGARHCTTVYRMDLDRLRPLAQSTTGTEYHRQNEGPRGGTQSGEGGYSVPPNTSVKRQGNSSLFSQRTSANGRRGAQEPTVIPDSLDTPDFRAAWAEWERHRAEMRHKLTPTSTRQQLRRLEDMGHDNAISAIQHSIANGYRGIFPPNERRGETRPRGGRQAARPPRAARRGEYAEKLSAEAIPTLNGRGGA